MYQLLKPLLFKLDAEKAHKLVAKSWNTICSIPILSSLLKSYYTVSSPALERKVFGITFPNPVGLAAGFDKDGKYIKSMSALGFGFIEVGTVTPKPQEGNPQPRLFRLPKDKGLINRMGFNNDGLDALVKRLKSMDRSKIIIGGNIGKNKITPNADAISDYEISFDALHPYVDYFVVNVSSPNTPNLRELQDKEPLTKLLSTLIDKNKTKENPKPILLKIAPDLTTGQLDDIIDIATELELSGIIATNTTISRDDLVTDNEVVANIGNGGLSGAPVKDRSTEVIRYISQKSNGAITIIGVGGICSAEDAIEKIEAGASLIQVYSGMIYAGPGLIKSINKEIAKKGI